MSTVDKKERNAAALKKAEINIVNNRSSGTKHSSDTLEFWQTAVRRWGADPDNVTKRAVLDMALTRIAGALGEDIWYKEDIDTLKETLFTAGETLLQAPKQNNYITHLANDFVELLWRCGWWQDWADMPQRWHVLAHLFLQAARLQPPGQARSEIPAMAQRWRENAAARLGRGADVSTQETPVNPASEMTVEQLAETLFGPSWIALYGDLLEDTLALSQHLREVQPPFAWVTRPALAASTAAPVTLPTDLESNLS